MGRKEQAEASREALIEAGRQCFTEHGYEATTVAGILERAGMARGALYHYFPDGKRELFGTVFERINDAFHERRDAPIELDSPLARIREGIRAFLELCIDDDFARIALIDAPRLVPGQADRGSSYRLLVQQLQEAIAADEVADVPPKVVAMSLYAAVRSAGEFVINSSDRKQAVGHATRCLDLLLNGLSQ